LTVGRILSEALLTANALMSLIHIASQFDKGEIDEAEVKRRIDAVKSWMEDSEKRDRDLFVAAGQG
jgi:hypothetical protein